MSSFVPESISQTYFIKKKSPLGILSIIINALDFVANVKCWEMILLQNNSFCDPKNNRGPSGELY